MQAEFFLAIDFKALRIYVRRYRVVITIDKGPLVQYNTENTLEIDIYSVPCGGPYLYLTITSMHKLLKQELAFNC